MLKWKQHLKMQIMWGNRKNLHVIFVFVGRSWGWDSVQRDQFLCGSLFMFFWHTEKGSRIWILFNLCQNNIFLKNLTKLESLLLKDDIIDVYICGLASDICVGDLFFDSFHPLHCLSTPKSTLPLNPISACTCMLWLNDGDSHPFRTFY